MTTLKCTGRKFAGLVSVAVLWAMTAVPAAAVELLTNGDFSAGLGSWTVTDQAGGSGSWFSSTVGTATPLSGLATSAVGGGVGLYAVSDQTGPGAHALTQSFTVTAGSQVMVTFDLFANDSDSGPIVNPAGLDYTATPNQHARVDILTAAAGALSTAAADVVTSLLPPFVDPQASNPNPFTAYAFDITPFVGAGGTFQIRFAEVDNQLFFNMGVDNVSIMETSVPEPTTILLLGLGLAGLGFRKPRTH